jgi:hypothetical protein
MRCILPAEADGLQNQKVFSNKYQFGLFGRWQFSGLFMIRRFNPDCGNAP